MELPRIPLGIRLFIISTLSHMGTVALALWAASWAWGPFYPLSGGALLSILLICIGMGATVLAVVQGTPPEDLEGRSFSESLFKTLPMFVGLALVVMMGTWIPAPILALLDDATRMLGGTR